ncbi:YHS domain-containing (seleno)protein [Winogradskyella sp.]|uniref:YHS domain-containing (seleno)protein n=1 Tax=Winogradskyella sp. TaxID=1883156 RepID=UPI0025F2BF7B|nr:YHS domain-containing (seleno)protein [Winogradskyella sp.]
MRFFILLYVITISTVFSQNNLDYNTKKGFAAKGYDVVAYFNNGAIEGSKVYSTTFNGVKYKFHSQKNLDTFLKNPKAFIPQYGGYCAYAVATNSKKIDIDPKSFEIRDGKLYLFYNSWGNNTLKKWLEKDVKGLQNKADLNWEAIKFN